MRVIKITGTGLAFTGHTSVSGISLIPDTAEATIVLNDSLDGTGNDMGEAKTQKEYSTEASLYGQMFSTGIYVTLTGAGAVAYIYVR